MLGTFFTKVPKDPSRVERFSSVGNSINNVLIDRRSGASFGTRRFFVITPDANMDGAVRSALGRLGVPSADIVTEPVPSAGSGGVRIGLGRERRRSHRARPVCRRLHHPHAPFPARRHSQRPPEKKHAADLNALEGAACQRWG